MVTTTITVVASPALVPFMGIERVAMRHSPQCTPGYRDTIQTTVATSAPSTTTCTTTLGNSLLQPVPPVAALKLCSITALYTQQYYKDSSRSADLLTPPLYLSRLLHWPASEYARLSLEPRSNRTASSRYNGYRGLPLATRQSDSDATGRRGFPGCPPPAPPRWLQSVRVCYKRPAQEFPVEDRAAPEPGRT